MPTSKTNRFFPYARPDISEDDISAVAAVLRSQFLTQGAETPAFEEALAKVCAVPHAVACSNGTAALHLAYLALGLSPGTTLLTAPITFLATANAARMTGAAVAFADVDPATGHIDPDSVRNALKADPSITVVAPVHLGGRIADMPALHTIATEFGCRIVEDACHALGATYRDSDGTVFPAGSCAHSDVAAFSFHAIKHIAMGEGGAACTRNPGIADEMALLRSHGLHRDAARWEAAPEPDAPWYYEMTELGWNYRLTDFQAALGRSQLRRLDENLRRRRAIAERYREALEGVRHLRLPVWPARPEEHSWHLFPVAIDFARLGRSRGAVMRALHARGVGTQVHYIPLYHQPYYKASVAAPLPGTEAYYATTLSIPMYPQLEDADIDRIAGAVREELSQ
ncbi:MAG: UDP-4-amino-4,6-dideoxy-N-acetyl-beta-L-altrosamine transaminase [Alphaproteobacteria bacterium]